ncbi:MAG: hypothetical protein JSS51_01360 [Planctomycetes bacterium]|nr:hypothetical protein [Planctomycetota bacterium]
MADMKTTIGADDADFQRGMDRINARLTSFDRWGKEIGRSFSSLNKVMGGFGVMNLASHVTQAIELVKQFDELAAKGERLKATLGDIALESMKASNAGIRSMSGDANQTAQDVFAKRAESLEKLNQTATEYEATLRQMSILEKTQFRVATAKSWMDLAPSMSEIYDPLTGIHRYAYRMYKQGNAAVESEIESKWSDVRANEALVTGAASREAEALKRKQQLDADKQTVAEMQQTAAESAKSWQDWFDAQSKFNRDRDEEAARLREMSGDSKGADLIRMQSRLRDRIREIESNDSLSAADKLGYMSSYRNGAALEEAVINARYLAEDEMRRRRLDQGAAFHTMSGSVGGVTFAQQLAALTQPAEKPLLEMKEIQAKILKELITRLPKSGLVPTWGA